MLKPTGSRPRPENYFWSALQTMLPLISKYFETHNGSFPLNYPTLTSTLTNYSSQLLTRCLHGVFPYCRSFSWLPSLVNLFNLEIGALCCDDFSDWIEWEYLRRDNILFDCNCWLLEISVGWKVKGDIERASPCHESRDDRDGTRNWESQHLG